MWIFSSGGGIGTIVNSADGVAWTSVQYAPGFSMDGLSGAMVFKNNLWLIGPKGMAWKSADGATYEMKEIKCVGAPVMPHPYSFSATMVDGRIVILSPERVIWSDDGETWSQSSYCGVTPGIFGDGSVIAEFGGKLWVINKEGLWFSK